MYPRAPRPVYRQGGHVSGWAVGGGIQKPEKWENKVDGVLPSMNPAVWMMDDGWNEAMAADLRTTQRMARKTV